MKLSMASMRIAKALGCVLLATAASGAQANEYPNQVIRFTVPMAPGGGVDTISRLVAEKLADKVGQSVVVDNKAGAGGLIAASHVARAQPDGYTVFVADTGQLSVNPSLYKELPYDRNTQFVPVTEAVSAPLFLAVNASLPINNVQEFIDYAKKNPGLPYGSTGVGAVHHLGMELLASRAGIELVHVPYKGAAQSTQALVAGDVKVAFSALPSLRGHVKEGRVKLIAVATPERTVLMPELPTIAESGVKDFSVAVNIGFVLPPKTSAEVANYLNANINEVLADKSFQERLLGMGLVPMGNSPEQYGKNIQSDTAKYQEIIKSSGVSAN